MDGTCPILVNCLILTARNSYLLINQNCNPWPAVKLVGSYYWNFVRRNLRHSLTRNDFNKSVGATHFQSSTTTVFIPVSTHQVERTELVVIRVSRVCGTKNSPFSGINRADWTNLIKCGSIKSTNEDMQRIRVSITMSKATESRLQCVRSISKTEGH